MTPKEITVAELQTSGTMTASDIQILAHAPEALVGCQMSWPLERAAKHLRPHTEDHDTVHFLQKATSQPIPLRTGSGNPQRFAYQASPSIKCNTLDLHNDNSLPDEYLAVAKFIYDYVNVVPQHSDHQEANCTAEVLMGYQTRSTSSSLSADCSDRQRRPSTIDGVQRQRRLEDPSLPYRCLQCSNTFATDGELQRHARNHVQGRPHRCPECDKSFLFPKDLKRHMLVHNRLPPITCRVCGKAFVGGRRDNFTRHMTTNHPGHPLSTFEDDPPTTDNVVQPSPSDSSDCSHIQTPGPGGEKSADTEEQARDELFRFRELSEVVRELNDRVENMLSSTETRSPPPVISDDDSASKAETCCTGSPTPSSQTLDCSDDGHLATELALVPRASSHYGSGEPCTLAGAASTRPSSAATSPAAGNTAGNGEQVDTNSSRKRKANSQPPDEDRSGDGDGNGGFRPNGTRVKLNPGKSKERHACFFPHQDRVPHFDYPSQLL